MQLYASHFSTKQQILYTHFINILSIYLVPYLPSILWREYTTFYLTSPLLRNIEAFFNLSVNLTSVAVDVLAHVEIDPFFFLDCICRLGFCSSFNFQRFSSMWRGGVSLVYSGGDGDISSNCSKFRVRYGVTCHLAVG